MKDGEKLMEEVAEQLDVLCQQIIQTEQSEMKLTRRQKARQSQGPIKTAS